MVAGSSYLSQSVCRNGIFWFSCFGSYFLVEFDRFAEDDSGRFCCLLVEFWRDFREVFFEFFEKIGGIIPEERDCVAVVDAKGDVIEFDLVGRERGSGCTDLDGEEAGYELFGHYATSSDFTFQSLAIKSSVVRRSIPQPTSYQYLDKAE